MVSAVISRIVILVFGTLYPAYASYKAVSTKNVKEYVKWMMYWIVFAFFTCAETFTDILLAFWFPFYYEIKIILVIWLLSPVTKGSSILYRKFVHPQLAKHEAEIDRYILRAKQQGYSTVFKLGVNGLNFARDLIVQAALTGRVGLVEQLKRSYSLNDITSETDGGYMTSNRRANTLTEGEIPAREDVDEIMDADRANAFYDSDPDTADGPTVSSGYSSAQDVMIPAAAAAAATAAPEASGLSSSSTSNVRQRTTRNSQKTSSRKTSTNAENAIYATLPRSSKRTSRKKIIPDFGI